ncbi:MAG: fumarate reductase subunit FrdD [Gammaproteobacteria bacterium]|nr:fumarate reductase subunit FrdD [Gammaproteobacteria bacterium]
MAASNKPIIWLPFAAGGTVAAFVMPSIMVVVLLATAGYLSGGVLDFERIHGFVAHPFIRACLFFLVGLPLWHAAHRLRMTVQDLGARSATARRILAYGCYLSAGVATLLLAYSLMHGW